MQSWSIILSLVILLGLAAALGVVFERLRQSAIVGYLLAGALAGPGGFRLIPAEVSVQPLAELGVSLLLFTIGLEFSLTRLKKLGVFAAGGGTLQILLTALLFGLGAAWGGASPAEALVIGLVLAPSSTACVLRLLRDRTEMDSQHGRNATGILLLQDLALVPLVLLVSTLGHGAAPLQLVLKLAVSFGIFLALVAGLYLVSSLVLVRLLHATARLRNRELLMLLAATVALGATWAAHALGLSPALGAFMAGLMLASSPLAAQLRADVAPLRTLFVTLFFVSVGMLADLPWIAREAPAVVGVVLAIIVGKAAVVAVVSRIFRFGWRSSVAAAVCLAQVGEFSFVLVEIARAGGQLSEPMFRLLVSATLVTMALTPLMVGAAPGLGEWVARRIRRTAGAAAADDETAPTPPHTGHVVVVGYGPAGRTVARMLQAHGVAVAVLDLNPKGIRAARADGFMAELGDATQSDILEHLGVASARALVMTLPDHRAALAVIRQAVALAPETPVLTRARYNKYASELLAAGSRLIVDEEECLGRALSDELARLCGLND